ncbi:replication initiator protein A [Lamprobacter modestohalophilus]|uniref:replication initiator protein A n=1 Tax=Lamprobacter modestohalophilus TaxID=1064514 RepID=UPI002ADEB653|nr:replication initiator protein A [Lamprobacter modestohalophilus]MEA1053198.1 replication initiator protein A [Lamprobacter modestohalophilus]
MAANLPSGNELFVCDLVDVVLKDDMASMEHPFYSLSKNPDYKPRRYEHNGKWIEFRPSVKGLPTIYDKDLIIYAISQLVSGIKEGEDVPKEVEIDPYAFLQFTRRATGGREYQALVDSLDRIDGTRYRTNVVADGTRTDEWMGLIDKAKLQTDAKTGRPRKLKITLSDMIIDAIRERAKVLTLHRDYFSLHKPIQRRIYELARKHCGRQDSWRVSVEVLRKKSGSRASLRGFRRSVRELTNEDPLPDYSVSFDEENDMLCFQTRHTVPGSPKAPWDGRLSTEAYEEAKRVAPGWDVYHLESQWRAWLSENEIEPTFPDRHFQKFCRSWYERRGPAR